MSYYYNVVFFFIIFILPNVLIDALLLKITIKYTHILSEILPSKHLLCLNATDVEILILNEMVLGGGTSGRSSSHEGGALRDGISVPLNKRLHSYCFSSFPTASDRSMRWKDSSLAPSTKRRYKQEVCHPERTLTPPCWPSDLRLPASSTVRNTFLFFISYLIYGISL